jgi:hypothetical protein
LGQLNIKCSATGNKVIENVNFSTSLETFIQILAAELGNSSKFNYELGVSAEGITIKKGFPPRPVSLDGPNLGKSLLEIGIKNKETLIVEA